MALMLLPLLVLFLSLLCSPALAEGVPRVAVATDLHFISPRLTDNGPAFMRVVTQADGKVMLYSESLLSAFIRQMLQDPPDALILAGDLTFNGASESHRDLAERLGALRDAGIPVFVIPGNHDLNYPHAARFHGSAFDRVPSPDSTAFAEIWQDFGLKQALARDPASLSYTAELAPGWRLLMLDVNTDDAPGRIKAETCQWAKEQIRTASEENCRIISCSHQTLLRHNPLFEQGFRMENAEALLSALDGASCLHLSGHMHIQHIAQAPSGLTEITGSALCVAPCQYGVLFLLPDTVSYRTEKVQVPAWASAEGLSDPNLLNFTGYALSFFASSTLRQAAPKLRDAPGAQQALLWMANTNIGYFSGRLAAAKKDEASMSLLQKKMPFWYVYFKSIEPDLGHDYNEKVIPL